MKNALLVLALVGLGVGAVNADGVTSFTDDFTGADGTSIIGDPWGYVELGVQLIDWQMYPRTQTADEFKILGNELYTTVTPPETTDPDLYNLLEATIYPKHGGSQASLTMGAGETVVCEIDLIDTTTNAGCMWNASQWVKVALSGTPDRFDEPFRTWDSYVIAALVHPNTSATELTIQGMVNANSSEQRVEVPIAAAAEYPYKLRMELDAAGNADFYLNDMVTPFGSLSGVPMTTVYPTIWFGKFNGDGGVLVEGDVTLDNYSVSVTPEPASMSLLALGGLAGLIRKRR